MEGGTILRHTINVMDSSRRILSRGSGLLACAFSIGVVPSAIPIHATEPPRADEEKMVPCISRRGGRQEGLRSHLCRPRLPE